MRIFFTFLKKNLKLKDRTVGKIICIVYMLFGALAGLILGYFTVSPKDIFSAGAAGLLSGLLAAFLVLLNQ